MSGLFKKKKNINDKKVDVQPKITHETLEEYYNNVMKSHSKGKVNQSRFYIRRIIESDTDNIKIFSDLFSFILKIQYDDYEDDADFFINKIIQLDIDNENNWMQKINFQIDHLTDYGGAIDTINEALNRLPESKILLEKKCNILVDCYEEGLEILRTLKILKEINPSHELIQEYKETAIEILIAEGDDDNPEAMKLIERL